MAGDRSVSIGRVFERAFAVMGSDPGTVLGASFLFGALPTVVFQSLTIGWRAQVASQSPATLWPFILSSLAINVALQSVAVACVTHATVSASNGRGDGFAASLAVGLRRFLPLIAVWLLATLAIGFAFLLLLVPGIMLAMRWAVLGPVIVEEQSGVFGGFARASRLTQGARWKIFGLMLVLIVGFVAVSLLVGLVSGLLIGFAPGNPSVAWSPVAIGLNLLTSSILSAVSSTMFAALYVELRDWKDGPVGESLAAVFQ